MKPVPALGNPSPPMLERAWPDAHADLARALQRADAYPTRPHQVQHLETHISHVFIADDVAYKIKKPVSLGFLDYSTPALRRQACDEELRINRRLAPDLYLSVVPITGTPQAPVMEGTGPAFEHAVKMRAFAQQDLLDNVLARGELKSHTLDTLAAQLAAFHRGLDPAPLQSGHGTAAGILAAAIQNFDQLQPLTKDSHSLERLADLRAWTVAEGGHLQRTFEERRLNGRVRECHGDLHLGNVALVNGSPCLFDAIDFSAPLRWIDVMSEVAFLTMDLWFHRREDLAFRFLNQYLEASGDYDGVPVLRFYLVYRAMVRAKVLALRACAGTGTARECGALLSRSDALVAWAIDVARQTRGTLIILHGFSGSGKSSRSMTILETIGAIRIRSDVERKRLHGADAGPALPQSMENGLYGSAATEATYAQLAAGAQPALEAGFPVLVDATFLRRAHRDRFRELARHMGAPFVIADFIASPDALRTRVAARAAAGNDVSDADIAVLEAQMRSAEPLDDNEMSQVVPFDTERSDVREIREQARRLINATRP